MAEALLDLRDLPREAAWRQLADHVGSVLDGVDDEIAAMATISSLVHHAFGFLWTGFYRVAGPRLLRVGPYQGTLGCMDIEFGRGVCGTAAEAGEPLIVDDVLNHPNHITCDPRARSEMVVPVFDGAGELIAVFDVDAAEPAAFSEVDQRGSEAVLSWFARRGATARGSSTDAQGTLR